MIKGKEKSLLQSLLKQFEMLDISSSDSLNSSSQGSDQKSTIVVAKGDPVIKKKWQQFKKFTLLPTISSSKVYYLFGFTPINETSFEDPQFQESLMLNYVRGRIIKQVEVTKYAVVLEFSDIPTPNQPALQYLIERFRAKGDIKFYQFAQTIKQVRATFAKLANVKTVDQNCDSYRQIIRDLGDRMYSASFGANRIAFSKKLLEQLEYDPEEFAVEAIKYRTISSEVFSTICYPVAMKFTMQCLINLGDMALGNITYHQFLRSSKQKFQSFLVSKNNVKSYCDFCFTMITPSDFLNIVEKIHYKADDFGGLFATNAPNVQGLEARKRVHREEEYPLLLKLQSDVPRKSNQQQGPKTRSRRQLRKLLTKHPQDNDNSA